MDGGSRSPGGARVTKALQKPRGLLVSALLGILAICILGATWLSGDPLEQELGVRLLPPAWMVGAARGHPLGTDHLGRDVLSRLLYGGRLSMFIGIAAAMAAAFLGTTLGVVAGIRGGRVGDFIMRLADVQHAFPFIVLAIAIIAVIGASLVNLLVTLALWGWASFARVSWAEILSLKEREFIQAARAIGASSGRIVWVHFLPNLVSPLIVLFTFSVAQMVVAESSLSFLGLGIPPPDPSWGSMLSDGRVHLTTAWWLATFPGLMVMVAVLGVNLLGDLLRDVLDPRFTFE